MPNDPVITKIILQNFKRFDSFEVDFNSQLNILIGDNEAGKSSILQAIDIVLSGSRNKIESVGLDNLFNYAVIENYLKSERKYELLPELSVELYLNELDDDELCGKYNNKQINCNGLRLVCAPNDDFSKEITDILLQPDANFPFEYYSIEFSTFANKSYNSYKKFVRHIVVDNSQTSSEYAIKEYVQEIYNASVQGVEKLTNQHKYRDHKEKFTKDVLSALDGRIPNYSFGIKNSLRASLENDLAILENNISIENKGKGRQCFIKTELALRSQKELNIILIEEPENHLSHSNMQKLIRKVSEAENKQIFIATHSDLISARLDLRKTILLNSNNTSLVTLNGLSEDTAKFFMKSPDNNILRFVLSNKVILVEGNAEYILMDAMYRKIAGKDPNECGVHIIAVGGTSFKRYLEIAKILAIKTAVITDNDGEIEDLTKKYIDYAAIRTIKIFYDTDKTRKTFEI